MIQPTLFSLFTTPSDQGILDKSWYLKKDGRRVLVKGSSQGCYEAYAEAIVSRIADEIDIPHVKYWLEDASLYSDIEANGKHVSVCDSYLDAFSEEESVSALDYLMNILRINLQSMSKEAAIDKVIELVGLRTIQDTFFLDAIVGNIDRHLRNIEVIIKDGVIRPTLPFDFGRSLLSYIKDSDSIDVYAEESFNPIAKPLDVSFLDQLNYVDFKERHYYADYNKIIANIEDILVLLPTKRANAIRHFLYWRCELYGSY